MSRISARGGNATEDRPGGRRRALLRAVALALPLALPLAFGPAEQAAAQSNSGIYINNDVLNSLGPGPSAAPTPMAPAAPQAFQAPAYQAPAYQAPGYQTPGGLGFQTQGSGNFVVTRPGTLLFPPLQAPSSTLAPGFQHDNNAARSEALNNAFAGGPEPSSQLLIPLQDPQQAPVPDDSDAVVVFEDQLPAADPQQPTPDGERIVLRMPPNLTPPAPAAPKPAVPAEVLAEYQRPAADPTDLAPEFQAPELQASEPAAPEVPAAAPAIADVEEKALAEETREAELAAAGAPAVQAPAGEAPLAAAETDATPAPSPLEPAPQVAATPAPATDAAAEPAPASSADVPAPVTAHLSAPSPASSAAPVAMNEPAADAGGPVSLLPADNAAQPDAAAPESASETDSETAGEAAGEPGGLQTASLTIGRGVEDMTFLFDVDCAELSRESQAELRYLADTLRGNEDWIQVLGFASGQDGADDQARKLALSRALKVRSFLIDAGIPSRRIQVRSMGDRVEGGPANRVDIKPVGS